MSAGDLVTFHAPSRDRESLPCLRRDVIGRAIEFSDQVDVLRVVSGDRVRIDEMRGEWALVTHARCKDVVCLVALWMLHPIANDLKQPLDASEEDVRL